MVSRCESGAGQEYEPPVTPPPKRQRLDTLPEEEEGVGDPQPMEVDTPTNPPVVDVEIVDSVLYADGYVVVTVKSGDDMLRLRYKAAS